MKIDCGLGLIKSGEYYYTDCCGNFITGTVNPDETLQVSFNYNLASGNVGRLDVTSSITCATPTPTPTPTITPTNTITPTQTPTNTLTPTPSITPSITPSNTPVTRLKNDCDTITLFDMGISCNVIQSPTDSNPSGGVLSINVTGGTAPYTFTWNGKGGHNQTLFGVPAGSYEVVVTDYSWPDGSPDYTATTICELLGPLPTSTPTSTPTPSPTSPVQCVDLCLIAIGAKGIPNVGPIQFICDGTQNGRFKWTSGRQDIIWNVNNSRWEIYYANTTTPFIIGNSGGILASTSYELIPDSAWVVLGGTEEYSVTMTKGECPTSIPLQVSIDKTNSSCQGTTNCNGSISIFAQDGISPYLYSIDGGITFSDNSTFTNLCPNTYTVVVSDSNNDSQTSTITIDYDSTPVTYQLSLANSNIATPIIVPNVSQTITQSMTLVVNPLLPVGVSVTFDLLSTALITVNRPGNGVSEVIWTVTKNGVPINVTVGPTTTVSQGTRPYCSPSAQEISSIDYGSSITITNGDIVVMTSTTKDIITNGQVSSQTNCTTNIIAQISAVISTPTIIGNTCSSVVGSSRQVQTNDFTYVPTVIPPTLPCFGYLYNFYAVTGLASQSLTSNDDWSVPSKTDFDTLLTTVSNDSSTLRLVNTTMYWNIYNTNATNSSGFSAIGNGFRVYDGSFFNQVNVGPYLSKTEYTATQQWSLILISGQGNVVMGNGADKKNGSAVRLVKNTTTLNPGQTGTYVGNNGRTYPTICIGTQEWLSEDLKETMYRNLSLIPNVTGASDWSALITGAYCIYNNNSYNISGCSPILI